MVSQCGGAAARQGHRCRAPDTELSCRPSPGRANPTADGPAGNGPSPARTGPDRPPERRLTPAGGLLSYCEVRHRAGPPWGCPGRRCAGLGKGPGHPVDNGAGLVADGVDSGPKGGPGPLFALFHLARGCLPGLALAGSHGNLHGRPPPGRGGACRARQGHRHWAGRRVLTVMDGSEQPTGRIAVIIPTYNERENIDDRRAAGFAAPCRRRRAGRRRLLPGRHRRDRRRLAAGRQPRPVLHRADKAGLGAAYLAGFRWALDAGYDVLVEMDADGSHRPEELPLLLDALETRGPGARLALGAGRRRARTGRSHVELLSRGGNTYARIDARHRAQGRDRRLPRLPGRRRCERIALDEVASPRATASRSTWRWRAIRAGLRVVEVPITFVERVHGASKMSRAIVVEAMWRVTVWGITGAAAGSRRQAGGGVREIVPPD